MKQALTSTLKTAGGEKCVTVFTTGKENQGQFKCWSVLTRLLLSPRSCAAPDQCIEG